MERNAVILGVGLMLFMLLTVSEVHARGLRAPAYRGPNGNIGAWLGSGPLFGWDMPYGNDFPWGNDDDPLPGGGGSGGSGSGGQGWMGRDWKKDDNGGGGWNGGPFAKGCLKETIKQDWSMTVFESSCFCSVAVMGGLQQGTYAEGVCVGGSPVNRDCEVPGDCCVGKVPAAEV